MPKHSHRTTVLAVAGTLVVALAVAACSDDVPILARAAVDPASPTTLVVDEGLTINLPAGAVEEAGELTVSRPPMAPAPGARQARTAVEIKLLVDGKPVQPAQPIDIVFAVPPEELRDDLAPEEQLSAGWYDEGSKVWVEEPVEIAAGVDGRTTVTLRLDHLTSVAQWILRAGWIVTSSTNYRLYLAEQPLMTVQSEIKKVLDRAWDAYVAAGYPPPTRKVPVYIYRNVGSPVYQPLLGYVELDAAYSEIEVAHEVFHAFQNAQLNMFSMNARKWWVEAMAEHAAATIVLKNDKWADKLGADLLKKPLGTLDGTHEYGLASLAEFLARSGGSPKEAQGALFKATLVTGHGESELAAAVESQLPVKFERFFQDFGAWVLRATDGPPQDLDLSAAASATGTLGADAKKLTLDVSAPAWALGVAAVRVATAAEPRAPKVRVAGCPASVWVVAAQARGGSVNHALTEQSGELVTTVPPLGDDQRLLVLVGGREACAAKVTVEVAPSSPEICPTNTDYAVSDSVCRDGNKLYTCCVQYPGQPCPPGPVGEPEICENGCSCQSYDNLGISWTSCLCN